MTRSDDTSRRQLLRGAMLLGGAAALPLSAFTPLPAFARPSAARDWPAVRALQAHYISEKKLPGLVIGIAHGDGPPTYLNAGTLGFARRAVADPDSIWRIYSMTKPVTGVLAAMLIDEGKIALDQPIADFLPRYSAMQVAVDPKIGLSSYPARTPITIRHLLTHTAGLSYHFQPNMVARAYRRAGLMPGLRRWGREAGDGAPPAGLQAFADAVAKLPLTAEPGRQYHYSISLDVLGAVLEKAGDAPFEAQLQDRIFNPLDMADTGFVVAPENLSRFATNNMFLDGKLQPFDAPPRTEYAAPAAYPSGGGGLASSAADYLKFMRMIGNGGAVDGTRVMSPEAARLVVSDLLPQGVIYDEGTGAQGYGAGGRVITAPKTNPFLGAYGWGGAAGTLALTQPSRRFSVILMTQYMPYETYPIRAELIAAISRDLARR